MAELPRVIPEALSALGGVLAELGSKRVLLITGPSRRGVEQVVSVLGELPVRVFDEARRHVPKQVVEAALRAVDEHEADTLVSLGGGSTTGLAKALKLERDVRFVAIPTTYAGSEYTNLYGVTEDSNKVTGRDDRVRPDVVLQAVDLTSTMPRRMTVTSLFNALAHPISVLSTGEADRELTQLALSAAKKAFSCAETLVRWPAHTATRRQAMEATRLAAEVLQRGKPGLHHRLAHFLGGRFDLDHSGLHAALLPHTVRHLRLEDAGMHRRLSDAIGVNDLEAALFDLLVRADAATSLRGPEVNYETYCTLVEENPTLPASVLHAAYLGRRPMRSVTHEDWGLRHDVSRWGPTFREARRVVVALHGRGSTADAMVSRTLQLTGNDPAVAIVAPQAPNCSWYSKRYTAPRVELGPQLQASLKEALSVIARVRDEAPDAQVVLLGFSQGACLGFEVVARLQQTPSALVALSGSGIGGVDEPPEFDERLSGMPVLMGASQDDPWLQQDLVKQTAKQLEAAGCDVALEMIPGDVHTFHERHRWLARPLLTGRSQASTLRGFCGEHESESLHGALPRHQNSPRRCPFGLYAEQVNATGFVAARGDNQRAWLYRIRPSAQHGHFEPLAHRTFVADFDAAPEVNLAGFSAMELPTEATDFVDGMATVGGAGSASLRRGYAVHIYAANRNMVDRAFCNADGELLIVPQLGTLTLQTEFGFLEVAPGSIALIPRGVRFSVLLREGPSRGYVAEAYGRRFELPDRGPAGANGLTDSRHFRCPPAWHEDRLAVGYRITHKLGGHLFEARQDYSPYDVVAWHGNLAPMTYDLREFSPLGNARFDHADPSLLTVLSAPMDERGANTLDFVVFVPRWDATEGTFRPPYFHRNVTTEFNGIIRNPGSDEMFQAGGYFLTPSLTPHGVRAGAVERALAMSDEHADNPARGGDDSLWFQFETTLPFSFTSWGRQSATRQADWAGDWGTYRVHFDAT